MVYLNSCNCAVDIYLLSGAGSQAKSEYGATYSSSRQFINYWDDLLQVGKDMLEWDEFMQAACGGNEKTSATSDNFSITGGHVDTEGRRIISFIGCEDMTGFLLQETKPVCGTGTNVETDSDGRNIFGFCIDLIMTGHAGGAVDNNSINGSRAFGIMVTWQAIAEYFVCRGRSNIIS